MKNIFVTSSSAGGMRAHLTKEGVSKRVQEVGLNSDGKKEMALFMEHRKRPGEMIVVGGFGVIYNVPIED